MKKTLLFILTAVFLTACTTKEQDEKIHAFWAQQAVKAMSSQLAPYAQMAAASLAAKGDNAAFTTDQFSNLEDLEIPAELKTEEPKTSPTTPAKRKGKKQVAAKAQAPVEKLTASLYLSPTCPWCNKVKKEGFTKKFNQKYGDLIVLTEYTLDNNQNMALYSAAIKKHKLSGGVPLLIIGDTPIQGYSEQLLKIAGEAAEKEIKKHNLHAEEEFAANTPAVLEISLEDENIGGTASAQDKEQMKKLILDMQDSNGAMIQSIGEAFGPVVKNQALEIAAKTEKQLKKAADTSTDFSAFFTQYTQISTQNMQSMNQLMKSNTGKIRKKR